MYIIKNNLKIKAQAIFYWLENMQFLNTVRKHKISLFVQKAPLFKSNVTLKLNHEQITFQWRKMKKEEKKTLHKKKKKKKAK
jgi:hypothetical protein